MNTVRVGLFAVAMMALAGGGYYVWKNGVALPETISQPVFTPLSGAVAEQAVLEVTRLVPDDVSSSLPIATSMADIPFTQFFVESNQPSHATDDGDAHADLMEAKTMKARLYRFENPDICDGELCPMGLYPVMEDGQLDFKNPIFIMIVKSIEVSSRISNGNPDLIVDFGSRGGKERFVWSVDETFPAYQNAAGAR